LNWKFIFRCVAAAFPLFHFILFYFFIFGPLVGLFRALPLNRGSHRHTHTHTQGGTKIHRNTGGNIMPMDTI